MLYTPIILWCHYYNYRSFVADLIIILLVLVFLKYSSNSKPFLKFIKLSFDLCILIVYAL